MFYYDPSYLLLIPGILLVMYAQFKVNSTYDKYSRIRTINGYTGAMVARKMLDEAGLFDVPIKVVNRKLGDYYDPSKKEIYLSPEVYNGDSIASLGVAAHEVGHAIQYKEKYAPIALRNGLVPLANIGNALSWTIFFAGIIFSYRPLVYIGIFLFIFVVAFSVFTLPVEFDASRRAIRNLQSGAILYGEEVNGAKAVLKAAALTYIAATLQAILQLVRLLLIANRNDDR